MSGSTSSAQVIRALGLLFCSLIVTTCSLPRGKRWDGGAAQRPDGAEPVGVRCGGDPLDDMECFYREGASILRSCEVDGEFYRLNEQNCTAAGQVCIDRPAYDDCATQEWNPEEPILGCSVCSPCARSCVRNNVAQCLRDGTGWQVITHCDTGRGEICSNGRCGNGCELAERYASNVGCEYYAADLDNAVVSSGSAARQQFALVVSNPSPLEAYVSVERCLAHPCEEETNREAILIGGEEQVVVNPDDLETLLLDANEVDGSPEGVFNEGTHSALTHRAYRVVSTAPIVLYQFNPYDNRVNVFSNDASLLIPVTALGTDYWVLSWPQTIAYTPDNPITDMNIDLRSFLTIVGTEPDTRVRVHLTADVVPDGEDGAIRRLHAGETLEVTIGPFDVLNLESGYFNSHSSFMADFTGTQVESSHPVAVFTGSEAADVPFFEDLTTRYCCGDHLEQQLPPRDTLGFSFVVPHTPPRTQAVAAAGGDVTPLDREPEWFRVLAVEDGTEVETTAEGFESFSLDAGEAMTIESETHFRLIANQAVAVGQFVGSQWTTGMVASDLPGGDPAFMMVPPVEQWRRGYVFLIPDKYAFDFVMVMVSTSQITQVTFDGEPIVTRAGCARQRGDGRREDDPVPPEYYVITCALSQPEVIPGVPRPHNIVDGIQEDGVHEVRLEAGGLQGIGLSVYGFDSYVSYGYPGGTDLRILQ